jgi:hypothetical protein
MRLDKPDEQAHHCDVQEPARGDAYQVDAAVIGGRKMPLPGEVPTLGGKSAKAIADFGNELSLNGGGLTKGTQGLYVRLTEIRYGSLS